MIINGHLQAIAGVYAANASSGVKRGTGIERSAAPRDEVTISSEAQSFNDMLKELRGMDETRRQRVSELSAQIEDGSYHVESSNIAASMLNIRF